MLYICVGNSCRSPMAEAITRALGCGRVDARSAGLAPLGWVAGPTIDALRRRGFDPSGLYSKGLDDIATDDVELVVSLIGSPLAERVPSAPGGRRISWSISDPYGEDETVYLEVVRELEERIRVLLARELESELPTL